MIKFGRRYDIMIKFGRRYEIMIKFGRRYEIMIKFGRRYDIVIKFGRRYEIMIKFGRRYEIMIHFGTKLMCEYLYFFIKFKFQGFKLRWLQMKLESSVRSMTTGFSTTSRSKRSSCSTTVNYCEGLREKKTF
jgi:hypothetical protein